MQTAKAIITPNSPDISLDPLGPGHGHLLRNIVLFGRMLRAAGMEVTPTQILDLVEGLKYIDLRRREDFKHTAQTILVSRFEHLELFSRAFDLFWQAREENELLEMDLGELLQRKNQPKPEDLAPTETSDQGDGSEKESEQPLLDTVYTYSAREILRQKDFADLTPDELQEIKKMMQEMAWEL